MSVETLLSEAALAAIWAPLGGAGATLVDPPVLQPLSLLLDMTGEDLRARLFVVQGEAGEELALRPDFTLAVAREHVRSGSREGRYAYEGKAFRASPRGVTRATEFLQIGLECIGGRDPVAEDAEILTLAWQAALAGGRKDLSLELGDVGLFAALIDSLDLAPVRSRQLRRAVNSPARLQQLLSDMPGPADVETADPGLAELLASLPRDKATSVLEEVWRLAGIEPVAGRTASDIAQRLIDRSELANAPALTSEDKRRIQAFLAIQGDPRRSLDLIGALAGPCRTGLDKALAAWMDRLAVMSAAGVPLDKAGFSTKLGRGFGYYDGLVFQVDSAELGSDRPVAAGGRYDGLIARLGGQDSRAIGCMVRPGRAWISS